MAALFEPAVAGDAPRIAELRNDAADRLTARFGRGHWSGHVAVEVVAANMERSRVYVLRERDRIVATLRLLPKRPSEYHRPWFTHVRRPVYLYDMAVDPAFQGQGHGRTCLEHAILAARDFPADSIRLDAYDHAAGAGGFYEKCGFHETGRRVYFRAPIVYYERML